MKRPITKLELDDHGDWTARLSCGHRQRVRDNRPMINRAWAAADPDRGDTLVEALNCPRCDAFDMPAGFVVYRRSPSFTAQSAPAELMSAHATDAGVWAKIFVATGKLKYHVPAFGAELELSAERPGIVVPEVVHRIELSGPVSFFLEFYRAPSPAS